MGVKLQSSSGGSVEIAAPVTASNYVLTAPAASGTILNDASSLAAAMLTGNVDVARLVSAFSGSNVSLAANGYQKLPSGLIIQWTKNLSVANSSNTTWTYPIAFPNSVLSIVASPTTSQNQTWGGTMLPSQSPGNASSVIYNYASVGLTLANVFAIGY